MIWFSCKQCGKVQSRPETASGTMVFCTCGHGTTVPWESTAEPAVSGGTAPPPVPPKMRHCARCSAAGAVGAAVAVGRSPRRRYKATPRDPNYCFNHEGKAKEAPCADCHEGFCRNCLVEMQGQRVCGPCKNYRLRLAQRPPLLHARGAEPVPGLQDRRMYLFPLRQIGLGIVLGLEAVALVLALVALRETERDARFSGQGLAWTGVMTAIVIGLFTAVQLISLFAEYCDLRSHRGERRGTRRDRSLNKMHSPCSLALRG